MAAAPAALEDLREWFPTVGEDVLRLFAAAAENANLLATDFFTIRDLVDYAGPAAPPTLHVLLLCLILALEEGSLCVEASNAGLERRLFDLAGEADAKAWASRIHADLQVGFPKLIGTHATESKPVVLVISGNRQFFYFQKYLLHETVFRDALCTRLTNEPGNRDLTRFRQVVEEVLERHPLRMEGRPLVLDERQRQALDLALSRDFAVISGGPGTGKTSIVLTLLRCLVRTGCAPERIALAAPTGRAAQRLTDAVRGGLAALDDGDRMPTDDTLSQLSAHTLHRLLHYSPTRGTFGRHRENTVPADLIIVDEVSMVGVALMSQLLQATGAGTKLILLGDKDQLPSVEAGAVLASLVPNPGTATPADHFLVVLEENYRSQPEIRAIARAVNQQDTAIVDRLPVIRPPAESEPGAVLNRAQEVGGCWLWPQTGDSAPELRRALEVWARHQYLTPVAGLGSYAELVQRCAALKLTDEIPAGTNPDLHNLFQVLGRARLLTIVREGPWGCVDMNRLIAQILRPRGRGAGREGVFAGAPILVTRNDYACQLFNGDVGISLPVPGGGQRVVFPRQGGFVSYPADSLPAHEPGFALTVHKSQGSEYGQVLLVLPPQGARRLLTKEIVYTGITRAKQLAVICSTKEALQFAVSRRIARDTGLSLRGAESAVR